MWRYDNVSFIYSNPVDSVFGTRTTIPYLCTYIKSRYALINALTVHLERTNWGDYVEIDQRTITHDPPYEV